MSSPLLERNIACLHYNGASGRIVVGFPAMYIQERLLFLFGVSSTHSGQHFACLLLSFICKKEKEEAIRRRWWTLSVSTCRPPCLVLFSCCDLLSRKRTHTDIRAWASRATKQVLGSFLLFPPPSFSFLPSLLFLMAARLIHGAD